MMASDLLERLLEATPSPPEGLEADAMIAAFQDMHTKRQAVIDSVCGLLIDVFDRAGVRELAARHDAWHAALAATMDRVREQRIGAGKLRRYAGLEI